MLPELQLDCDREFARIIAFIRQVLADAGYSRVVVGLSGGVDSALTTALCVEALGATNVRAVLLPYETSNPESEAHARLLIEALGLSLVRFEITDMVRPLVARYPEMSDRRKGNIMARCRMIALFDQSVSFNGLVAGTSNRTELLLGYFTLHGDGAASFEPIGHLYKCQVRALARHLGVPGVMLEKAPSADLWKGQTDEGELGFTYDEADQVLYLVTERGFGVDEVVARGFAGETVAAIAGRMEATAFKRRMPPVLPEGESRTWIMETRMPDRGMLVLENGSTYVGRSVGASGELVGEVVFSTGMSGYQEAITDPSFWGQMVAFTCPHIGNVGVNLEDVESDRPYVRAILVRKMCERPSNWRSRQPLPEYLKDHGIPALSGLDTRGLTLTLRDKGVMRGALSTLRLDREYLLQLARLPPI